MALRTILICGQASTLRHAGEMLSRSPASNIVHTASSYPDRAELRRILQSAPADVIVLDFDNFEAAVATMRAIRELGADLPVVALNPPSSNDRMLELVRHGIGHVLDSGSNAEEAGECLRRAAGSAASEPDSNPRGHLCCFLPGKPGSGTSILAVNCALAIAQQTHERVLLCDLDLACATATHYLKVPHDRCVRHAVALGPRLNASVWESLICQRAGVDVIGAGALEPAGHIDSSSLVAAMDFLRSIYGVIVADCSGALDHWCLELLRSASHIFLTTTFELPAMHLSRSKARLLQDMHLNHKTTVLLNRADGLGPDAPAEVESLLGIPVYACFGNDYRGVMEAFAGGTAVNPAGDLGKRFHRLASMVLGRDAGLDSPVKPRRRLLDLFARGSGL